MAKRKASGQAEPEDRAITVTEDRLADFLEGALVIDDALGLDSGEAGVSAAHSPAPAPAPVCNPHDWERGRLADGRQVYRCATCQAERPR